MIRIFTIARVVWLDVLRRKDIYVIFVLLFALSVILASMDIFGLGGVIGYVKEIGLFAAWLFAWIISVNVSTRLLPDEETKGTVFCLLARPVTRAQVIAGKWLGCWTVVGAAAIVFYAALTGFVMIHGSGFRPAPFLQTLCLHLFMLGMLTALGTAFSTRMNRDAAAAMTWTVSLASFFLLPQVSHLALNVDGFRRTSLMVLFYALPHFELFDMRMRLIHNWDAVPARTFLAVLAYGGAMTAVFLVLGWLGYRSKLFSRGVMQ